MKLRRTKYWFIAIVACIVLCSALLYSLLQNPAANNYHPAYRTLWQAYFWVDETRFGWFGLEGWRLEGVNTETAVYFGKFQYYDIPLSAPAVAAIGFAGISTLALLCFTYFLRRRRQPPNKSPEPTAVGAAVAIHAASRRWLSFFR